MSVILCVFSPSCCVGLIFSMSSPLMLTMTIWVVQLDRPGSRQVTALTKRTMRLLLTLHPGPLQRDKIQPGGTANAIKCTYLCIDTWSDPYYFSFIAGFFLQLPECSRLRVLSLVNQSWAQQRLKKSDTWRYGRGPNSSDVNTQDLSDTKY